MKKRPAIHDLLAIMARLRAPDGCPWDRQQTHASIRFHAVEEVYEMIDAIEAGDDDELEEELGDLLLQVVFHCQLARERGAFDFERVARRIADKLIHRHPHVFGDAQTRTVAAVWEQWDRLKKAEKHGTRHQRDSALDGIPRHLPALLRAQKLVKKAAKAGLATPVPGDRRPGHGAATKRELAATLFALAQICQEKGWSAEELLRQEVRRAENKWRRAERKRATVAK
jgi:uncharacterized protein YabN with tetrapyrrole methylase and pyrophosphatase domain